MALFSGRSGFKGVVLALTVSTCLSRFAFAVDASDKNSSAKPTSSTQPSTEVFDVKEKDIPSPPGAKPSASGADIPPPDFKEFEDDKFINNLLDENGKKAAKPSDKPAPAKEPEPSKADVAPAQKPADVKPVEKKADAKGVAPAAAVPTAPAKDVAAPKEKEPAKAETPSIKEAPAAPDAAIQAQAPTAPVAAAPAPATPIAKEDVKTVAPVPTVAPPVPSAPAVPAVAQDTKAPDAAPVAPVVPASPSVVDAATPPADATVKAPDVAQPVQAEPAKAEAASTAPKVLSEEDKNTYSELKKHLLNFISSAGKKADKPAESKDAAKVDDKAVTPETKPAEVAGETKPAPDAGAAPKDDLDLLEPSKKADSAVPPAADQNTAKAVEGEVKPTDAKPVDSKTAEAKPEDSKAPDAKIPEKKAENAPVPVDIKNPDGNAKNFKSADVVEELPQKKPSYEEIDESEVPVKSEKQKLSDADKAYLQMLDKQRESLPAGKRLSGASMDTLAGISAEITPDKKDGKEPKRIKLQHGKMASVDLDGDSKAASGKMDISVRKIGKGEDAEKSKVKLERAYKALLVGQNGAAISIYKEILEKEPENKDAMFGLATAYHKNSQFEQAREIYTKILKKNPADKEALNNFLVLVAEEAPEDALIELEKLERINSNFSPISAQIAMINLRLGNTDVAARYLRRAILLSPDNISYKYNLAVVYDKAGKEEQALPLYQQVVDAASSGDVVPGSVDKIRERMNYLENKISQKK